MTNAPYCWEVRPFQPDDVSQLVDIFRRAVLAIDDCFYTALERETWASSADDHEVFQQRFLSTKPLVVRSPNNCPIGFAEWREDGYIDCFYIDPQWQGKKVASALLLAVEAAVRDLGATRLYANVALNAQGFFSSHGFIKGSTNSIKRNASVLINNTMHKPL